MDATKTLIILTPGFPADEADTACISSLQVFVKACKDHHPWLKIVVLSFQYPFTAGIYRWHGISVHSFNGRNRGKAARWMVWYKVWKAMKKIKSKNDVMGVLSFWLGECALIGKHFSKKNKLKHITWILGQDARPANRYVPLIRPVACSLVAVSDFAASEYRKNYGVRPARVIPVGVDASLFDNGQPVRDIDVMGAGSLIPLKRYNLFIEVIKQVTQVLPNVFAVICGKGPEKDRLAEQITAAGLQQNIQLLDELPHKEVLQLMQRSKTFFHPSEYEGYGMVCAEALYAGSHVVSFCKPMNKTHPQHHIVKTAEAAVSTLVEILQAETRTHDKILDYPVESICKQMIDLFLT